MRVRSPFHSGCLSRTRMLSAMSPGRITVHGMMTEVFLPDPASPSTAPARMASRLARWDRLRADSSVCEVIQNNKTWPNRFAVGPFEFHPSDSAGQAGKRAVTPLECLTNPRFHRKISQESHEGDFLELFIC